MLFKIRCIGFTSWRSKFLGFIRSTLASHIVPRIRYLGFTTRGKKGPLTTTRDLSACKSTWSLIRLYTVNNTAAWTAVVRPAVSCCPPRFLSRAPALRVVGGVAHQEGDPAFHCVSSEDIAIYEWWIDYQRTWAHAAVMEKRSCAGRQNYSWLETSLYLNNNW
jgi:hypothetical protein